MAKIIIVIGKFLLYTGQLNFYKERNFNQSVRKNEIIGRKSCGKKMLQELIVVRGVSRLLQLFFRR